MLVMNISIFLFIYFFCTLGGRKMVEREEEKSNLKSKISDPKSKNLVQRKWCQAVLENSTSLARLETSFC